MKRNFAWAGAVLSGLYLLIAVPTLDPLPFIDEGVALGIFLKCISMLGYDLRKWLPFFRKKGKSKASGNNTGGKGVTIDV